MPEWVFIDTAILRQARESKGLSYESAARELHVSSKTWERYEKVGRIPRPLIPQVADLLGLEIEEPAPRRVTVEPLEVRVNALQELREHIDRRFDELDRKLDLMDVSDRVPAIEEQLRSVERALERL